MFLSGMFNTVLLITGKCLENEEVNSCSSQSLAWVEISGLLWSDFWMFFLLSYTVGLAMLAKIRKRSAQKSLLDVSM